MSIDFQLALRPYLLGRLEPETADKIERQLIIDQDLFERLEIEETELLDDYVASRLDGEDRKALDVRLEISSRLRQRLAAARGLRDVVDRRLTHSNSHPKSADYSQNAVTAANSSTQTPHLRRIASIALLGKLVAAAVLVAALVSAWMWASRSISSLDIPETPQFVENHAPISQPSELPSNPGADSGDRADSGTSIDDNPSSATEYIRETLFPAVRSEAPAGPSIISVPPDGSTGLRLAVELGSATDYEMLTATLERNGEPIAEFREEIKILDASRI